MGVSLSWLLPGAAHLLFGEYGMGVVLITAYIAVKIAMMALLVSTWVSVAWALIIGCASLLLLSIYASTGAFRWSRKYRVNRLNWEEPPRKDPFLAMFLTLLLPGLGHAYLRRWLALAVFAAYVIAHALLPRGEYGTVANAVLRLAIAGHAFVACSPANNRTRKHSLSLALTLIGMCLLANCVEFVAIRRFGVSVDRCVGESMAPTIVEGDFNVTDRFTYCRREPAIGEIIVLRPPETPGEHHKYERMCKRIVAIGGETIQVRNGIPYVNGQVREWGNDRTARVNHAEVSQSSTPSEDERSPTDYGVHVEYRVPEGHYFVLGDNTAHSLDSRYYGPIPRKDIVGRVARIWHSPLRWFKKREWIPA